MKFKLYEKDCETFNMCELDVLSNTVAYTWVMNNGEHIKALPWTTFPFLPYVEVITYGDKVMRLPKKNIKAIYK